MIAQAIGWCAAGIALLCLVGLFTIRVLWPAGDGQHAKKPHQAQHRDAGHEGAGSEGHAEELHNLGIDPPVTLVHREDCIRLEEHVPPIGFDKDEPEWDGEHGESFLAGHVGAVSAQCMCGHPDYLTCPDWLHETEWSRLCAADEHGQCAGRTGTDGNLACACTCHDIPLSAAIKQLRRRQTGEMADLFGADDEPGS